MRCLTSSKFSQTAVLLKQGLVADPTSPDTAGHYEMVQDDLSGEVIRTWVSDDPGTTIHETGEFKCQARGILEGGIRVAGATERWAKGEYENVGFVQLRFPKDVIITQRDRVTKIKGPDGNVQWLEEEYGVNKATIFDVLGVQPVLDPFGKIIEMSALLTRSEVQA